ncbi:uncharacterized protein [Danio rerio]|uniref:Uncharacterized protein n=1 Tax=Danio rerio TaxID=7955 RepID=A0AC58HKY6_DANRE
MRHQLLSKVQQMFQKGDGKTLPTEVDSAQRQREASMEALELELEAMESQICDLEMKRTQLWEQRALICVPRAAACSSEAQHTKDAVRLRVIHSGTHLPYPPGCSCVRCIPSLWAESLLLLCLRSPRKNRFARLPETGRDVAIIGDSIVRHVCAVFTTGDNVCTHCFAGARVDNVSAMVTAILSAGESIGAVVLHVGTNDTGLQQTESF